MAPNNRLRDLMAKLDAPDNPYQKEIDKENKEKEAKLKEEVKEIEEVVPEERKDPFPELEKKDEELKVEQKNVEEDPDDKTDLDPDEVQVEDPQVEAEPSLSLRTEQQIELLQNEGRFRLELIAQLQQMNIALAIIARTVGNLNDQE